MNHPDASLSVGAHFPQRFRESFGGAAAPSLRNLQEFLSVYFPKREKPFVWKLLKIPSVLRNDAENVSQHPERKPLIDLIQAAFFFFFGALSLLIYGSYWSLQLREDEDDTSPSHPGFRRGFRLSPTTLNTVFSIRYRNLRPDEEDEVHFCCRWRTFSGGFGCPLEEEEAGSGAEQMMDGGGRPALTHKDVMCQRVVPIIY